MLSFPKNQRFIWVAAVLLCLIFLSACQTTQSEDSILGLWRSSVHYYQFNEDGTWEVGYSFGDVDYNAFDWGTYTFDGKIISFSTHEEAVSCPGQSGTYELKISNDEVLIFTLVEDECENRSSDFLVNEIKRVEP
jgi:hypothetical protein